jgi:hypothetical protein
LVGKDASLYWNDIHSHVKFDILEDVSMGEGWNTGLDVLPVIMGRTEGPTPPELEGGLPVQGKGTYDEVCEGARGAARRRTHMFMVECEGARAAHMIMVECEHRPQPTAHHRAT